ncbi:nodal homolog [Mixophyes fleayi]|uniref:nodal homolog n=1 Tax=Mixophyes fleayi TaxID=3061075 RepID=UPI003F4DA3B4
MTDRAKDKDLDSLNLPNFMLSLYQSFHRLESRHGIELGPVPLPGFSPSPQADIIRSLTAKNFEQVGERYILVFDFSSLSLDEELQFVEVRIKKSALAKPLSDGVQVMVDVFHEDSTCQKPRELCQEYLHLGLFKSTPRSRDSESWVVIEATEIVHKWLERTDKAGVHTPVHSKLREIISEENAKRKYKVHTSADQLVLMFVYSNTSKKERFSVTATLLLDAAQSKFLAPMPVLKTKTTSRRSRRSHMIRDRVLGMKHAPTSDNTSNLCRRVEFIVDFYMIGWAAWIIHPKKYNAYRCEGTCPSPVNESVKPNNHSYLQSLVNLYDKEKAPEVCCVPIKMSSLSMAYYDHMTVAFQSHEAMIVEECGCR